MSDRRAVVLFGVACACARPEAGGSERWVAAAPAVITERVLITGELDALSSVELAVPATPAFRLTLQWIAEDGAHVEAGDKVAEFDNSQLVSNLAEKELAVLRAANDLASRVAQSRVDVADKRFALLEKRVAFDKAKVDASLPKELLALRTYQEYQLALTRAESEHDKARDELAAAEQAAELDRRIQDIKLEKAERDYKETLAALDMLTLTAPRDGIVVVGENPWEGRKLQVGDNLWPGFKVARLPDLTAMQVRASMPDVDDGKLVEGSAVRCRLDAYPDREFAGRVVSLSPVAREIPGSPLRRAFEVLIDLDKTDGSIMRPGMSVLVESTLHREDAPVTVPRGAVVGLLEAPKVARPTGDLAPVELGRCDAQRCAIAAGLRVGERVLEDGGR